MKSLKTVSTKCIFLLITILCISSYFNAIQVIFFASNAFNDNPNYKKKSLVEQKEKIKAVLFHAEIKIHSIIVLWLNGEKTFDIEKLFLDFITRDKMFVDQRYFVKEILN